MDAKKDGESIAPVRNSDWFQAICLVRGWWEGYGIVCRTMYNKNNFPCHLLILNHLSLFGGWLGGGFGVLKIQYFVYDNKTSAFLLCVRRSIDTMFCRNVNVTMNEEEE